MNAQLNPGKANYWERFRRARIRRLTVSPRLRRVILRGPRPRQTTISAASRIRSSARTRSASRSPRRTCCGCSAIRAGQLHPRDAADPGGRRGRHLGDRTGYGRVVLAGLAIGVVQADLSPLWLSRFRYGPLECL
ncbi:DUF418 domain-containing protein [Actinoplanes auranticolor]|uniref:DUF418 domain-containing protein n=1 Tax=Actinoplanes auranticolor TaxID=47988 RepID=UPI0024847BC9|nr:DUF418 domain-containing protein [Actinoplanes auranticolor]